MSLYLDNAATTFPKPASVYEAVRHAMIDIGANPGRASHRRSREASAIVSEAREKVARLFDIPDPDLVIFTKNATESINLVLKGWLHPGDRVLISGLEHNAVVRPLRRLQEAGVHVETIPCSPEGEMDLDALRARLTPPPRLLALTHASNVNGALQPMPKVVELCAQREVPIFLDAAQTAGIQPISVRGWNLGMFACSGHKALLGPPGVGVLYIRPGMDVLPLVEGGTGSRSEESIQPEYSPDRYESGTSNFPGIAGLSAGIDFIFQEEMDSIREHELALAQVLESGLTAISGVKVFVPWVRGTGTVSFKVEDLNPADVARLLDEGFDIAVRAGLHCAPLAHKTQGTFPEGTVRASVGYWTTPEDVEFFLQSLRALLALRR